MIRKFVALFGVLLLALGLVITAQAQLPLTGAGSKVAVAGGVQVTHDATTNAVQTASTASISTTHTAAGADRAAWVFAYCAVNGFAAFIDGSATYGGSAMTRQFQSAPNADNYYAGFTIIAPATGSQTVTVNFTAENCDNGARTITIVTLNSVNQTTPVGTVQTSFASTGTTPSVTVTGLVTNGLVVDAVMAAESGGGSTITQGANQTLNGTIANATNVLLFQQGSSRQLSSDGGAMTWTKDSNFQYAIAAIEFKPL